MCVYMKSASDVIMCGHSKSGHFCISFLINIKLCLITSGVTFHSDIWTIITAFNHKYQVLYLEVIILIRGGISPFKMHSNFSVQHFDFLLQTVSHHVISLIFVSPSGK